MNFSTDIHRTQNAFKAQMKSITCTHKTYINAPLWRDMPEMSALCLFLLHKQDKQLVYKLSSKFNYVSVETCYDQNIKT